MLFLNLLYKIAWSPINKSIEQQDVILLCLMKYGLKLAITGRHINNL